MRCRHMYRRPAGGGHHHHHHHLHHHSIYQHLAAAALPPPSALEAAAAHHHHPCMLASPCGCATGNGGESSVNNTSFTQLISPCQHSDSRYWSSQIPPPAVAAVAGNVPDDGQTSANRRGTLSATLRNWVNSNINWFQQPQQQAGPELQNNIQTISR